MAAKRKKKKTEEVEEIQVTEEVQEVEELEPAEDPEIEIEIEKPEPVQVAEPEPETKAAEKVLIGYKVAPGKGVTTRSGMVTERNNRILQSKDFGKGTDFFETLIEIEALVAVYEDVK